MNFEEGSPEQAKLPMLSGRHSSAYGTKLCAAGSVTFPCFSFLFCIKCVTQVTVTPLQCGIVAHLSKGTMETDTASEGKQVHLQA